MITRLSYPDRVARARAALALGRLRAEHDESVAEYVVRGMLMSPRPGDGVDGLTRNLEGRGRRTELLAARLRARVGLALPVPRLLEFLDAGDWDSHVMAAEILGQSGPLDVFPLLIERSTHDRASVRWAATLALGCMGTAKGVPHLERLAQDEDYHVRAAANDALEWNRAGKRVPTVRGWLGVVGNPRLVQQIQSPDDAAEVAHQLADSCPAVRQAAIEAIARSGSEAVVQWALSKLYNENQSDRWHAALALGEVGTDAVVPELLRLLEDQSSHIRQTAALATGRIGWRLRRAIPVEQAPRSIQIRAELLATSLDALASSVEA